MQKNYKFPICYHCDQTNFGYDRNYRQSIELASGKYIIVIGNDDTINPKLYLQSLARFLTVDNYPELDTAIAKRNVREILLNK